MKKFFISLLLLAGISGGTVWANGTDIDPALQKALDQEFSGARYVHWDVLKDHHLYRADFWYNNQRISAFFNEEASLVAMGRYIPVDNLPMLVSRKLSDRYPGYTVTDAAEYTRGRVTEYIVVAENDNTRLTLKAVDSGYLEVFKKEKKKSLNSL